ncbi:bifunctional 3-(3-hydroxy-phenyl)propionate/3-hydroxycinnamic acid hydroxylase [Sphingomonas carotinifaciens]|uniref:3-(3-hydroxy-phenyl)propionate hydroxylase n=1 Tax=Sphingomonas carotinifaciens TaxID=1166323 RepID=A0A1G7LZG5_9SPHN|nr:bifunctional 3-(3-hydroxy-phenyl)propionate/3-hydroxycinnamic acid hydroxylase [Sphingomonas carotinifaciens]MBB4086978.1 3-(3-hydroxy-phenyl)propionate hydroxylase [Sphingomonas carotinifaciens]MWC42170.1 bifunctional 3-(3-hydroxy-phenyl)propionate/3-hydroxycinnamic acid hydroxylase [Sphingomonas carotinifaciens]SDF54786.1 3-(3-hydroxy-phenyl)propionate hydroxylase [Sphingomonas carotinifaciens]
MSSVSYDIGIIGCGPVGALAANLAAAAGLSVLVIDRAEGPHPLPRAVHLDHEMMRLFQSVGLDTVLAPAMRETEGHLHIGADHGVIRYMGTAGRPKPFGWANDYFFYQPELEALLRDGLTRFDAVTLCAATELTGFEQDGAGVTLHLDRDGVTDTARVRWVIACDGARSMVRKTLGIALDDLHFEEPWLVVDAEVAAPVRFPALTGVPAGADLQQLSVMMCDPARPATIVPGRGDIRRWEFMLLPGEDEATMTRPEVVADLLSPYLDGVPHRLLRAATYQFHGLIAERWRDGRVFLAGDAAHQTPPFFGQGMCHGMRDVANLVWKLALVIGGRAEPDLLDSYQVERDPHVRAVVTAAVEAGRYICELDPTRAAERDAAMRERARSGQTGTAADLIPAYRAGVVANDTAGAGERFVQPRLGDGELLDSATGSGWRLIAIDRAAADAARSAVAAAAVSVTLVDATTIGDDGTLRHWLQARGSRFVLIRPDAYVFGTADAEPAALLERLHRALHLCPAVAA